jgi:glucosamine 6-phosphate synthetase-like amidotransferase/phosphosugar isomerase protein
VSRYQRWNALLDLLRDDGQLTVAEAAQALGVSEATIRRDLDQLAKQQLVTRTHGGATAGHVSYDLPLRYKTARHAPQKQRIGRAAAALAVSPNSGDEDVRTLPGLAAHELARPLPPGLADRAEFTFLGRGWAAAVAAEAALKLREAARTWAESYPAMEYRHGPISVSDENTVVWTLGEVPAGLLADARRTGATVITSDADPLAGLVGAQRLAAALAERKGIDPDQPRALSRSVILA